MEKKIRIGVIIFGPGTNMQVITGDGSVLEVVIATETHNHPCAIVTDERRQEDESNTIFSFE